MAITKQASELIQKYLRDELSEVDQVLFKESLNDSEFCDALRLQADILKSIDTNRTSEVKDFIQGLDKNGQSQTDINIKDPNRHKKNLLLYAASILAILTIFFLINLLSDKKSPQNFYAEYYKPYPVVSIERGTGDDIGIELYKDALSLYAEKEYDAAFDKFKKIEPTSNLIELYKSICLLEMKKPTASDKLLNSIIDNNPEPELLIEVQWYSMLAKLKMGDVKKVRNMLSSIVEVPSHPYNQKAQELLIKIEKN